MANGQAELEKYDEMIRALETFNQTVLTIAENMSSCGKICQAAMGSDQLSTNAVANLNGCVKEYREVTLKATALSKALRSDRDELARLIQQAKGGTV